MFNEDEVTDDALDIQDEVTEIEEVKYTEYPDDTEEVDETDWKAEAEKNKQLAENQRIRAEKAEKKTKTIKSETSNSLTTTDILALSRAQIDDSDLDEVLDYAKYKGISVKDALNSTVLKATLAEKSEERKSAQAVNTGATRRGSGVISDDRLMSDAQKGIMPDSDSDIQRLARLRLKNR